MAAHEAVAQGLVPHGLLALLRSRVEHDALSEDRFHERIGGSLIELLVRCPEESLLRFDSAEQRDPMPGQVDLAQLTALGAHALQQADGIAAQLQEVTDHGPSAAHDRRRLAGPLRSSVRSDRVRLSCCHRRSSPPTRPDPTADTIDGQCKWHTFSTVSERDAIRIQVPAPARARRSHAERTAETRRRVLAAVVETISECGFQRTTGTEIARRAGVSWGAVQHHFGDKNGILAAALEESFHRLAETLGDVPDPDAPLEERVSVFIDRAWQHFGSEHYRTTFEILLNLPPEMESSWAVHVLGIWRTIWARFFPDSTLTRRETTELMQYAVSVLSGLATTIILEGGTRRGTQRGLAWLKRTVAEELVARS